MSLCEPQTLHPASYELKRVLSRSYLRRSRQSVCFTPLYSGGFTNHIRAGKCASFQFSEGELKGC